MNKALKKTIVYRTLSILSEFVIVYIATGSLLIPTVVTILCILIHTSLYYLVEKIFNGNNGKMKVCC